MTGYTRQPQVVPGFGGMMFPCLSRRGAPSYRTIASDAFVSAIMVLSCKHACDRRIASKRKETHSANTQSDARSSK